MNTALRGRILVVDDEPAMCEIVERVLRDAGFDVISATSASEAIEMAAAQPPFDLVIADVMMPEMTGDEMVTRLRRADRNLKALYLTGYVDALFERKEILWEDEAFLEKPSAPQGLLEAVSLLLIGRTSPAV